MPKPFETLIQEANLATITDPKVLIVTATPVETAAVHKLLKPIPPKRSLLKVSRGTQTYYLGVLGKQKVVHVQCQMGSVAPGASLVTIFEAIDAWNVAAVIMVGIAFGMDKRKQSIGDVLISKVMNPYEIQRVGRKNTIQRGASPPAGATLLNRFTNCRDWIFESAPGKQTRAEAVALLSGEKLVDNPSFRKKLQKMFPEAAGGEMEGSGLFAAAHQKNVEWIVVKAICDFADGNKARGKKAKQIVAAASAASYCAHVLSQTACLEALGSPDIGSSDLNHRNRLSIDEALFEIYEKRFESAYLERKLDTLITERLVQQGIWISGPSGSGKTNTLRRAVISQDKNCLFIDLSKCVGSSVTEIFAALHGEISEMLGASPISATGEHTQRNQAFWIKEISKLIERNAAQGTFFFIDEIPLADPKEFENFVAGIIAILIGLNSQKVHSARFLLCSIEDPQGRIKEFQKKIYQRLSFISLSLWEKEEIIKLLKLILRLLRLKLSSSDFTAIAEAANGCPRRLKHIVRLLVTHRDSPDWTLERIFCECR